MKKIFTILFITIIIAGIGLLASRVIFEVSANQIMLLINPAGEAIEVSDEKRFHLNFQSVFPNRVKILRLPMKEMEFEKKVEFELPLLAFSGLLQKSKLRIQVIGSFRPIRGKMSVLYSKIGNDILNLKKAVKDKIDFHLKIHISSLFEKQAMVKALGLKGTKFLKPSLASFQKEMATIGINIVKIRFGLETNIADFSNFYTNVYNTVQVRRILRGKALDYLKLQKQTEKERIALEFKEKINALKLEKELARLEKVARFLDKYPNAYKVMVLDKLGKDAKVTVMPEFEKNQNIFQKLPEKSLQKNGENRSGSILKPGEFYSR